MTYTIGIDIGSGAVKITPAHDPNDYEASQIAITRKLASRMKVGDLATRTLEVLVKNHRINDIDAIVSFIETHPPLAYR